MKLVCWKELLNTHLSEINSEKLSKRFLDNSPEVVLIIYPTIENNYSRWESWNQLNEKISLFCPGCCCPIFLNKTNRQHWIWAFWNEKDALLTIMRL